MRVFRSKAFTRFAKMEDITDAMLLAAMRQVEEGLVDADLGGGLIKQRIARPGKGKSSGYRVVIVYRRGARAFFVHGFAKNARDNLTAAEVEGLKFLAASILAMTNPVLEKTISDGVYTEVLEKSDGKKI